MFHVRLPTFWKFLYRINDWLVGFSLPLLLISLGLFTVATGLLYPFEITRNFHSALLVLASWALLFTSLVFLLWSFESLITSYKCSSSGKRTYIYHDDDVKPALFVIIFWVSYVAILWMWLSSDKKSAQNITAIASIGLLAAPWFIGHYTRRAWFLNSKCVSRDEFLDYVGVRSRERASIDSNGDAGHKTILEVAVPRISYANIHGYSELKGRLLESGTPVLGRQNQGDDPRNGILLFGDPGNGKTFVAEALAGELKVKFLVMDYSKVVSQWVGETPKNIAAAFAQAKKAGPCVLFIDEIDSFIINRDGAGSQTAESANIVNVLLTELVNIRRYPVLVVAATNRLSKLDPAAIREGRFDFKIEVGNPDEEARTGLLLSSLRKHVKGVPLDDSAVLSAAKRWNGFSVKRIMAVGEEMPAYLREHPSAVVGYEQLTGSLRRIQGRKGKLPADTKPLEALVLPEQTRNAVELVASRIADPMRVERLGGTLPSGVLFHGPAGTGKTAVARALAKKTGWAFLSVAGPDLLRDIDQIEKLYSEAKELRPVLVFIDEADDILRERGMSNASAITNKLLTIMDGADGRVKDVVFIAATNNPDLIDPALLRAGRFTEKVPFFPADEQSAAVLVNQWLSARQITRMGPGVSASVVARMLQGQSPANIEGVLQYSLNLAISEAHGDDVVLTLNHIGLAYEVVVPQ
jgi:transitional endoplasmic reticulum ATPase